MSIGPSTPIAGSVAGTFLAQTRASDVDRAQQESNAQALRAESQQKAELASGVGQADGDNHQAGDRDADGRRPWEFPRREAQPEAGDEAGQPHAPDPTGQSGGTLDLCG
jgi:hypothetical protein